MQRAVENYYENWKYDTVFFWYRCFLLLDEHIDKLVRMVNVFCKMSSEATVVISGNVYWISKGDMENMGVKRDRCLPAKRGWAGQDKSQAPGHTDERRQSLHSGNTNLVNYKAECGSSFIADRKEVGWVTAGEGAVDKGWGRMRWFILIGIWTWEIKNGRFLVFYVLIARH